MILFRGTITLADGEQEQLEITQRDYVAWELWAVRNGQNPSPAEAPPMLWTRYLGYAAHFYRAGTARAEWPAFEDWDARNVDLEPPEGSEAGAPVIAAAAPFQADRSAG